MSKTDLDNMLFYLEYDIKYKLIKTIYPEIDSICAGDEYSLSFLECAATHDFAKAWLKQYNKHDIELIKIYQNILNELSILINEIKDEPNILETLYLFSYILYNGYLSVDNKFIFATPTHEVPFKRSLSVFYGQGVCRNLGELFNDFLCIRNIYSFGIITDRQTFESEDFLLNDEFYRLSHDIDPKFIETFSNMLDNTYCGNGPTGNHYEVVTHIKGEGWRLLDPSSFSAYKITKEKNEYATSKYLKFWSLYADGNHSIKEIIRLTNLLKDTYLRAYSSQKILDLQDKCVDLCEKNKAKIKTFHNRMYSDIKTISSILPKKEDF